MWKYVCIMIQENEVSLQMECVPRVGWQFHLGMFLLFVQFLLNGYILQRVLLCCLTILVNGLCQIKQTNHELEIIVGQVCLNYDHVFPN